MTLNTTEPLSAAMKFYEKHGYQRSGRVSDFFGMRLIGYAKQIGDALDLGHHGLLLVSGSYNPRIACHELV